MRKVALKAIIFDLDGTLLDTIEDLANSMNEVLAARGFPTHGIDAYKIFVGNGLDVLVERVMPKASSEEELASALSAMRAIYARRKNESTKPYPGVIELLRELGRLGIPFSVLSNKIDEATKALIAHFFPAIAFFAVRGQRPGVPKKPDPRAALELAGELGVDPARCYYLGDTNVDIETAKSAGMIPIGALWGFRSKVELKAAGAHALCATPQALLSLIEGREDKDLTILFTRP